MDYENYKKHFIDSGNVYDIIKLNSFVNLVPNYIVKELYLEFKEEWIKQGVLTYYAEDFPKYQNSPKLDNSLEAFVLFRFYESIN